jgi:hypothetical protein
MVRSYRGALTRPSSPQPNPARAAGRVERIIARVEAGEGGADAVFNVTKLAGGRPKAIFMSDIY